MCDVRIALLTFPKEWGKIGQENEIEISKVGTKIILFMTDVGEKRRKVTQIRLVFARRLSLCVSRGILIEVICPREEEDFVSITCLLRTNVERSQKTKKKSLFVLFRQTEKKSSCGKMFKSFSLFWAG